MITLVSLPMRLSAPYWESVSVSNANEPLPETGLKRTIGIISGGIFSRSNTGRSRVIALSSAPDARSIETAVSIIIIVGRIFLSIRSPFSAPFTTVS